MDMNTTPELFQKALSVKLNGKAYWNYVHKIRGSGSNVTFSIAKELCRSPQKHGRVLGIDVLCQLRSYDKPSDANKIASSRRFRPKESIRLIRPMLRDNRKEVLLSAIYALGHLYDPERSKRIAPFARHRDPDIRYAVAFALGSDPHPLSVKTLIQLTEDKDPQVRDWATFGIGDREDAKKVNSPEIREALFKRLHDTHADPRGEAMVGLAKRKDARVVEHIKRELRGKSPRVYALLAAEAFADPTFLPELNDLLKSCKKSDDSYWCGQLKDALNACRFKKSNTLRKQANPRGR
jgi:HEAT repeat protein